MFTRWYRENQKAIYELVILVILAVVTFVVLFRANFTEAFFEFTRKYERNQVDEFIVTLFFVLVVYLPVFTMRRWAESVNRLRLANTDSLTEIFNRRSGWEILKFELSRASRHDRPLSIILFDIDHFKELNDQYGHLVGDRALIRVAKKVQEVTRKIDSIVRWGGEEFLIICVETSREDAYQLAERLRTEIESSPIYDNIRITASFGVARFQPTETLEALVKRADDNVYQAKTSGRNRVVG